MRIRNITKKYNKKVVLNNLNLDFSIGEVTFIVGESGVGKSTLLNILGTLEKQSSGEVQISKDNEWISVQEIDKYRSSYLGFVFQDSNLLSGYTVKENLLISIGFSNKKVNEDDIYKILNELDIPYVINQKVENLSGGEKQRVAIARAVLSGSRIILADEPTGNLDRENSELIYRKFNSIKKDRIIIIVSHDENMANKYGDRIIRLVDGKIYEDIKIENNINNDNILIHQIDNENKYKEKNMLYVIYLLWKTRIKRNIRKIIPITITMALSLAMILLMYSFYSGVNSMSKDTNVNYLESDLLIVRKDPLEKYEKDYIYDEDIKIIENKFNFIQSNVEYSVELYFEYEENFIKIDNRQIEINDFFKNRILSYDIEGEFISTDNEVIIAEDVAIKLFGNADCIGKWVNITNGRGVFEKTKIVGVNKLVNPEGKILNYISVNLVKELISNYNNDIGIVEIKNIKEYSNDISTGGATPKIVVLEGNEELVSGRLPKENDEIIISYNTALSIFNLESGITSGDFNNLSQSEKDEIYENLFSSQYVVESNDNYVLKIVGICNSNSNEIRTTNDFYNKLKEPLPKSAQLYLNDYREANEVKEHFKNTEYTFISIAEHIQGKILHDTQIYQILILIISIVLALISIIQINAFIKINIIESEYDVGILKTLGATKTHIFQIFAMDAIGVSLFSILTAIIIYIFETNVLSSIINELNVINMKLSINVIVIVGIFTILISLLVVLKQLLYISRLSPIDAIRRR